MNKTLVFAEKPSVGRSIAEALGCQSKGGKFFENDRYVVTWALGHLVTLASPEKYGVPFEQWTMERLPVIPDPFKLEVISQTKKQYYLVKKLMERSDVKTIVIATDAGREGELVARWVLDYAHIKKPIQRLWISSVTDKAIKEGFKRLVDGHKYDNLYEAAQARAKADWIVGLNGTKALSMKHNASLSLGRVQTPALDLVYGREQMIQSFVPKSFYELEFTIDGITCRWMDEKTKQSRIFSKDKAKQLKENCQSKEVKIKHIRKKNKKAYASGLYDLTLLQRDANRLYDMSAKQTLNAMQSLYEKHKVLTYPRTDSKYLTTDIVGTLDERVRALRQTPYKEACKEIARGPLKGHPSYVDNKKVGDHHAIIPTEERPNYTAFNNHETKIYNLVVEKFLAVLMAPYEYMDIELVAVIGDAHFVGKTQVDVNLGWKKIQKTIMQNPPDILKRSDGETIANAYVTLSEGKTQPPSYLTEGDLLHEMEQAGLGTVATRSDIIEKIISNFYVEHQGKYLRTTKTGRQLLDLVPDAIRSKELTAKWEKDLEHIAKGERSAQDFLHDIIKLTKQIVREIKQSEKKFKHENLSSESCPQCGQKLLVIKNKYGKKLVCQDRGCGYKKNLSKTTNARCPQCHKKMELVGDKGQETFVCRCGYKEKLAAFNTRKDKSKKTMSKKEVQRYLKKSDQKNEPFNNPFANILQKKIDKD